MATTAEIDRSACPKKTGKHGTLGTYNSGCRCDDASLIKFRYNKRRRLGYRGGFFYPAAGTARRLQALTAIGWSLPDLAAELGVTPPSVSAMRSGKNATVQHTSADRVIAIYERLEGTPGPAQRAATDARRRGWAPPLAWEGIDIDDPAAVPDLGEAPAVDLTDHGRHRRLDIDAAAEQHRAGRNLAELSRIYQVGERYLRDALRNAGHPVLELSDRELHDIDRVPTHKLPTRLVA